MELKFQDQILNHMEKLEAEPGQPPSLCQDLDLGVFRRAGSSLWASSLRVLVCLAVPCGAWIHWGSCPCSAPASLEPGVCSYPVPGASFLDGCLPLVEMKRRQEHSLLKVAPLVSLSGFYFSYRPLPVNFRPTPSSF